MNQIISNLLGSLQKTKKPRTIKKSKEYIKNKSFSSLSKSQKTMKTLGVHLVDLKDHFDMK